MTSYRITPAEQGLAIEIEGVGARQEQLLTAFGECAAGQCSCPTDEYQKVEAMEVVPADDAISIRLAARPGTSFDTGEIERCLDYTVEQAKG
ncbi:MAG TPA: hypothetical protein VF763_04840 [Candidatus Limnocylindrales bacterium]